MPSPAVALALLTALDAIFIAVSFSSIAVPGSTLGPITIRGADATELVAASFWLVATLTMVSIGLYSDDSLRMFGVLPWAAISFLLSLIFPTALMFYWRTRLDGCADCQISYHYLPIWFGWLLVTRGALATTFALGLFKRRVLVLGAGKLAARIAEMNGRHHFEAVSFIGFPGEPTFVNRELLRWHSGKALTETGAQLAVDEIVVATGDDSNLPIGQLFACKISGIRITRFLDFWEREAKSINLEALPADWLLYSDGFQHHSFNSVLKRAFDIVFSLAALFYTFPLQVVTACLIGLESPGPIFYRQERVGLSGELFTILKFRSMRVDAEQGGGPQWAVEGDPRVTRVGRVIRKLRIDELPQLLNVLRGEMSLIGPRPERPFFVKQLVEAIPHYGERHLVRPGITGWAQVNCPYGASIEDAKHKLSFDLYYVKNRNLMLDLQIIFKTVRIIVGFAGR
jgi:sugar transferase (PEP-CTERM system associated)